MINKSFPTIICALIIFIFSSYAQASNIQGRVISVSSGDNFIMFSTDGQKIPVQLYGIAAPQRNQRHGNTATNFLAYLIVQKDVSVKVYSTDEFGRVIGVVTQGDKNINRQMIHQGYAWRHASQCRKASFCVEWNKVQEEAKKARRGLWSIKEPIPPWKWK